MSSRGTSETKVKRAKKDKDKMSTKHIKSIVPTAPQSLSGPGSATSDSPIEMEVQMMSTHDLINNPSTLQAGLSILSQCISANKIKLQRGASSSWDESSGVQTRHSGQKRRRPEETKTNENTAENNPEINVLSFGLVGSPTTGTGTFDNANDDSFDQLEKRKGAAQFGELFRRCNLPENSNPLSPSKKLEEFDLDAKGIFRSVFSDYDEKERMYEKHSKRIQDLTETKVKKYFQRIKPMILDIFEGRIESHRTDLYLSRSKNDRNTLKALNVTAPYSNDVYMKVANMLLEYILPTKKLRDRYTEYAELALIPEALIKMYSLVNKIDCGHAEKEMRYGPQYDGPLPKRSGLTTTNENQKGRPNENKHNTRSGKRAPAASTVPAPK